MENDQQSPDTLTANHCIDRGYIHESRDSSHHASPCNGCGKLEVYDWMNDIEHTQTPTDFVEVRFKNTRKGYFKNVNDLRLQKGEVIAVEASPGHDIGVVSLTGNLVYHQMRKNNYDFNNQEPKKIYRKAKPNDIEKWMESISREHNTMLKSRKIAEDLQLDMKIGDVEFQGDGSKAIFYYIADERVDFRKLIRVLAETFRIRIEMKQIGARQEAGRIGGIGPCGRELCCCTFMSSFISVSTNTARYQEVSLNPQKLAGQCSKLKCCLNFELNAYLDAREDFPDQELEILTKEGPAYHVKTDVFKRLMWYSYNKNTGSNPVCLSVDRVNEIIQMNRANQEPEKLQNTENIELSNNQSNANDILADNNLSRFDHKSDKKYKSKKRKKKTRKNTPKNGK
ncbi:MAG: hypothetical protein GVY19_04930 [Bacteroidetes bacterium]|jgi:cell fate regulator YaaT (PSP1 superfamily)|nr:hypothetical protein [Bacteroidota bacterium]